MKVIDILNKIANGKEVPKTIMYDGDIWKYDELSNDYEMFEESGDLYLFQEELNITNALNDEVEIIEDKKIEKLDLLDLYDELNNILDTNNYRNAKHNIHKALKKTQIKINKIINHLNKENK